MCHLGETCSSVLLLSFVFLLLFRIRCFQVNWRYKVFQQRPSVSDLMSHAYKSAGLCVIAKVECVIAACSDVLLKTGALGEIKWKNQNM